MDLSADLSGIALAKPEASAKADVSADLSGVALAKPEASGEGGCLKKPAETVRYRLDSDLLVDVPEIKPITHGSAR